MCVSARAQTYIHIKDTHTYTKYTYMCIYRATNPHPKGCITCKAGCYARALPWGLDYIAIP